MINPLVSGLNLDLHPLLILPQGNQQSELFSSTKFLLVKITQNQISKFPEMEVFRFIIHFSGISIINHPAIGVSSFMEPPGSFPSRHFSFLGFTTAGCSAILGPSTTGATSCFLRTGVQARCFRHKKSENLLSTDLFKGKSTGNHRFL